MAAVRILGVCGSVRAGSHNLRLLEAAALLLPAETRKALGAGARVLERELAVPAAHEQLGPGGALLDPELRVGLRDLLAALLDEIRATGTATRARIDKSLESSAAILRARGRHRKYGRIRGTSDGAALCPRTLM